MMIKYWKIWIINLILISNTNACDICGISSGFNSLGQINTLSRQYLLLESQHNNFIHPATNPSKNSLDQISTQQLHYAWKSDSMPRLQWIANLSYKTVVRDNVYLNNPNFQTQGLGDLNLRGIYTLYDNRNYNLDNPIKKLIMLQGGMRLPTGKYQLRGAEKEMLPMHLQPGNGSWQGEMAINSFLRYRNLGIQLGSIINVSTTNELNYKIGTRNSNSIAVFYNHSNSTQTLIPQVFAQYDWIDQDQQYKQKINTTGAQWMKLGLQIDWIFRKLYVRGRWENPISSNLSTAAPQPTSTTTLSIGILL
ncbi:MAG: hypothetical protein RLZZ252_1533 [Bacteroidota bacterium]|jgi:hypothetical protein